MGYGLLTCTANKILPSPLKIQSVMAYKVSADEQVAAWQISVNSTPSKKAAEAATTLVKRTLMFSGHGSLAKP